MSKDNPQVDRQLAPVAQVGASNLPHPLDGEWYVDVNAKTYGPYPGQKIREYITDGRISPDTNVMPKDGGGWIPAGADKALAPLFAPKPAPPAPVSATAAPGATVVQVTNNVAPQQGPAVIYEDGPAAPKSAGTALILSILIVGLGQLYNGQVGKGILMFVLCIALWFALLGWIINIWSWVDAYQTASRMNDRYRRRLASGAAI
jgi:TM2 domain-containing membrane protein YozV